MEKSQTIRNEAPTVRTSGVDIVSTRSKIDTMRILLVEDEKKIASFIERGLKEQRYVVDVANDGPAGSVLASVNDYDLIILDVMLPGMDGFSLCREIRKKKADVPILILT